MPQKILAKMICNRITKTTYGEEVEAMPVVGDSEENKSFSNATPAGKLELMISNKEAHGFFAPGAEYLIEITKVIALLLALLCVPSLASAQEHAAASVWDWTPILQALAGTAATILSALIVMLLRAGMRFLDAKTGWHTEQRYAAVARRRVMALEQTARRQIQADLEDGKITAEEARALVKALGDQALTGIMDELGLGRETAATLVEAAVVTTGAARSSVDPTAAPSAG